LQQHRIESHPIGKGLWVIALDTSYATSPYSSKGFFEKDLEDRLDECLSALPQGDFALVLNHYPFFLNDTPRRSLERGKALEAVLRRHSRARLYLHGHTHRQVIADLQESGLPIVLDSGSCAQKETGSWNLIDLDNAGCSVAAWGYGDGWKSIRTERFEWKR